MAKEPGVVRLRYAPLRYDNSDRQLDGSTPVMMTPRRRLIRGFAAINVKFSGNGAKKTLELPSSGDGKRAVNPTGAQGPL